MTMLVRKNIAPMIGSPVKLLGTKIPDPAKIPGQLLADAGNPLAQPPWEQGIEGLVQDAGDGWWTYTNTSATNTTMSLIQFFDVGKLVLGATYEIGAYFRLKSALGSDYRLALAEYFDSQWNGATSSDLDFLDAESATPVKVTCTRTVTDATSNQMRFAIQLVNPPAPGMKIDFSAPYAIRLS